MFRERNAAHVFPQGDRNILEKFVVIHFLHTGESFYSYYFEASVWISQKNA